MQKKAKRTRRARRSRQEKSGASAATEKARVGRRSGAGPPPLLKGTQAHLVARPGERSIGALVWIRRLDEPYSEFEEHLVFLPADWSDILDLAEPLRPHEFVRRARAFVCAGGATVVEQERKFAREDYGGGTFLCWVVRAFDERRVEIRVESQRPVPIEGVTAAEWSSAAERAVLDLVRRHGGTFRVPPPEPGRWVYPDSCWSRTPLWPVGQRPEWDGLAEATLQQIDMARRADAKGWTERARYHERAAVEGLTKLLAFEDARAGRLSSMGGRKTALTPAEEAAVVDECRRRKAGGEKLLNVEEELARRYRVSERTIRELRRKHGATRPKGGKPG